MIILNKVKLSFHFYNPNTVEETVDYITEIFIEVNQEKVERTLKEAAEALHAKRSINREKLAERLVL